jgi:hypothetical protein
MDLFSLCQREIQMLNFIILRSIFDTTGYYLIPNGISSFLRSFFRSFQFTWNRSEVLEQLVLDLGDPDFYLDLVYFDTIMNIMTTDSNVGKDLVWSELKDVRWTIDKSALSNYAKILIRIQIIGFQFVRLRFNLSVTFGLIPGSPQTHEELKKTQKRHLLLKYSLTTTKYKKYLISSQGDPRTDKVDLYMYFFNGPSVSPWEVWSLQERLLSLSNLQRLTKSVRKNRVYEIKEAPLWLVSDFFKPSNELPLKVGDPFSKFSKLDLGIYIIETLLVEVMIPLWRLRGFQEIFSLRI